MRVYARVFLEAICAVATDAEWAGCVVYLVPPNGIERLQLVILILLHVWFSCM